MHGRFLENEKIKIDKSHEHDELETHRSLKAGEDILECLELKAEAVTEENCKEYTFIDGNFLLLVGKIRANFRERND